MTDPTSDRSELSDTSPASGHTVQSPDSLTHYLDFEVEIGIGLGREYPISVLRSPAGEARETMHFPFDELALDNRLKDLQIALLRSGGQRRQLLSPEEQAVQIFGRELFNSLLAGEARSLYDVSCNVAKQQGRGLRVKLRILPPELAQLPWEFLYDSRQAEFVCMSRDTPIVRYLELPHPVQPLAVTPPLRVLGMTASPRDLPALDIAREKQRMEEAIGTLQSNNLLELTWLDGSTWRDLQRAMRGGPWHIFHFVGHGGFDRNADEGLIVLEDERGLTHRLLATDLGRLLSDHHSLRLTLLNSCEGARGGEHDIFSSTAAILVRRGIPAVLAMQYEITDRAAIEFARAFYEAMTDGLPVDGAVAEARKAVGLAVPNTVEWGTPVLYMRAPQGMIFQMPSTPSTKRVSPKPSVSPRIDKELAQRLQQLYTDGLSAYWVEDWDKACGCFQAIVESKPDYQDAAAKLTSAKRQLELSSLYTQAQTAVDAKDWVAALAVLEPLAAEAPNFKDATALLDSAKRERRLSDLYAEAQQLYAAKQWQAVVNVFTQILALQPNFVDPAGLLASAQREAEAVKRQAGLNSLYARALHALDSGRWQEAVQLFTEVKRAEPDFRDTDRLLTTAQEQLARQDAEQHRQEQITTLYEQALGLARARQWRQALVKIQEIRKLDAQFADPENIAARAQVEIEREEQEAQRQSELATMYADAVRLLKASKYQEALEKWRAIQAIEPRYQDRNKVQETASRKLAELQKPIVAKRRKSWWPVVAIGGLAMMVIVVLSAVLSGGGNKTPTPTAASMPIVATTSNGTALPEKAVASLSTPAQASIVVPTVTAPATMTLRVRVNSSSDWTTVILIDTAFILDHIDRETDGGPVRASVKGNAIELNQAHEKASIGNVVSTTKDLILARQPATTSLKFGVGMGCMGVTTVEIFNIVTDLPTLVGRHMTDDCNLPYGSSFTVETKNLLSKEPMPAPTPHPGEYLYQQGVAALQRNAYSEAVALFDKAITTGWDTANLYLNRAFSCERWHSNGGDCNLEQALADCDQAITLDPKNREIWFQRAILNRDLKKYQAAISDFDQALTLDSSFVAAYQERGHLYCNYLNDQDKGLVDLNTAVELAPNDAWVVYLRGLCYGTKREQQDKQVADYNRALALDPKNREIWFGRAMLNRDLKKYQAAISDFNQALELDSSFVAAYQERGYLYCNILGDQTRGLVDLNKAVELAPDNAWAVYLRGLCYGTKGEQWDKQIADLTEAIRLDPDNPDAYGHRGYGYQQLGQIANARADYLKFIQMTEGNPNYRDWRQNVQTWLAQHPE